MSEKIVSLREARLELFLARCALDSLRTRFASEDPEAEDQGLFVQPFPESVADLEAALKTLRAYAAQQDPDGAMGLCSPRKAAENSKPTP